MHRAYQSRAVRFPSESRSRSVQLHVLASSSFSSSSLALLARSRSYTRGRTVSCRHPAGCSAVSARAQTSLRRVQPFVNQSRAPHTEQRPKVRSEEFV